LANVRLDTASPERFRTTFIGKRITDGRSSRTWYLRLKPWGPQAESSEAAVSPSLYHAVNVGEGVCADMRPGALGIAWYIVQRCEIGE
jgi:hypothetical protein